MTALEEFAAARGRKKTTKVEWVPPVLDDFHPGAVIGIDQSLANCGICVVSHGVEPLRVIESLTLRTSQVADGPEDTLLRFELMRQMLTVLLRRYDPTIPVRHEMPLPIRPGMKGQRPESAWLAAGAVRAAAVDTGHPVSMMGAQHHKKTTVGIANADKQTYHFALMPWAAEVGVIDLNKVTNVDERDALGIALTHLLED